MKISGQKSAISGVKAGSGKEKIKMAKFWTCPYCGCNLDLGETCDCRDEEKEKNPRYASINRKDPGTGKAAGSAA